MKGKTKQIIIVYINCMIISTASFIGGLYGIDSWYAFIGMFVTACSMAYLMAREDKVEQ
jgi:hypothetical protein